MKEIIIRQCQQPSSDTCVHACLSMVTGIPVDELVERFGKGALDWEEETVVLVENGILPQVLQADALRSHPAPPFPLCGVYLVTAPSLNRPGLMHRLVVEARKDGFTVHDPQTGREGKQTYGENSVMEGELCFVEVTYLNPTALRKCDWPRGRKLRHEWREPLHVERARAETQAAALVLAALVRAGPDLAAAAARGQVVAQLQAREVLT